MADFVGADSNRMADKRLEGCRNADEITKARRTTGHRSGGKRMSDRTSDWVSDRTGWRGRSGLVLGPTSIRPPLSQTWTSAVRGVAYSEM